MTTPYYTGQMLQTLDFIFQVSDRQPNHKIVLSTDNGYKIKFPEYRETLEIIIIDDEVSFTGPDDLIKICVNHIHNYEQ